MILFLYMRKTPSFSLASMTSLQGTGTVSILELFSALSEHKTLKPYKDCGTH
ncbi:hypothetical protein VroAM7_20120 [Vibrio rotiferianus]|uniref:Uncharacterized protein n=1 Tax=Vibrio rotiferianus TaxID=190895 RepID=A0A510I6V3_9VIBR|nr:hypothetical protein VroAM7_20120 [Vibrio rotiferianus]